MFPINRYVQYTSYFKIDITDHRSGILQKLLTPPISALHTRVSFTVKNLKDFPRIFISDPQKSVTYSGHFCELPIIFFFFFFFLFLKDRLQPKTDQDNTIQFMKLTLIL
jgi:hypothetical protein